MRGVFCELEGMLDHDKREYVGQIYKWHLSDTVIHPIVKKASLAHDNAVRRCRDKDKYPTYAGITVDFSKRELIYWWIIQNRFFNLEKPTMGRINHSKSYSMENIRLEEHSDNSKEVFTRNLPYKEGSKVSIFRRGTHVATAKSLHQASVCTGVSIS